MLGEYPWHSHEDMDEMFFIKSGELIIKFESYSLKLVSGRSAFIPRGTLHQPIAKLETCAYIIFRK